MFEALLAGTPRLTRANYGPRAISFAARAPDSRELTWTDPDRGTIFQIVFAHTPVRVGEGLIVVRANAISSLLREAARLSLGMLGVGHSGRACAPLADFECRDNLSRIIYSCGDRCLVWNGSTGSMLLN